MALAKWDSKHLAARYEYWCKRLRLGDWKCRVTFANRTEMLEEWGNEGETLGWCIKQRDHKSAVLRVLNPKTEAETYELCCDKPERVLVHEMLHVAIDPIEEIVESVIAYLGSEARSIYKGRWRTVKEQVVNQLADALVNRQDAFK